MLEDVARPLADGGPAADSLNPILILILRETLAGPAIVLAVLDLDDGPAFGERALRTLGAEGAPLKGLDVALRRVADDWHEASALPGILGGLGARRAISSEVASVRVRIGCANQRKSGNAACGDARRRKRCRFCDA